MFIRKCDVCERRCSQLFETVDGDMACFDCAQADPAEDDVEHLDRCESCDRESAELSFDGYCPECDSPRGRADRERGILADLQFDEMQDRVDNG